MALQTFLKTQLIFLDDGGQAPKTKQLINVLNSSYYYTYYWV